MKTIIMYGKPVAENIKTQVKEWIERDLNHTPELLIITIGNDDASKVYVKNKLKAAAEVGINATNWRFTKEDYFNGDVEREFDRGFPEYDAVILQLPVPSFVDTASLIEKIPYWKDVDGLTIVQKGRFESVPHYWHPLDCLYPCTPQGITELLDNYIDIKTLRGKNAVVIGRSDLVGKPIAKLLLDLDMTVTICHSKTKNLAEHTQKADLLICAAGKQGLINANMVKEGVIIVDVSINRNEEGKLCGDVLFDEVAPKCKAITPVPGGVGPMTVAMLMFNTYLATRDRNFWENKEKNNAI